ncbi:DNA topoisomerase 1 [Sesamum angolense]|uniref:DNA topoisomerase 1 n=1 Tax=Sesamum angolense TaxID=2727404 RepID=A0AAE1W2N9_9LAMI|nr:DNA topoisomerase 1 [Sesamum angolense]
MASHRLLSHPSTASPYSNHHHSTASIARARAHSMWYTLKAADLFPLRGCLVFSFVLVLSSRRVSCLYEVSSSEIMVHVLNTVRSNQFLANSEQLTCACLAYVAYNLQMDLQIKHAVVVKFIGMTCSRGQVTQNWALKGCPRICVKCSFPNAEKTKSQRLRTSCALGTKSERKIHSLMSHADAPHSFSAFRFRAPFGCELYNTRMPMKISNYGLIGGPCSTYYGSITRSFSQIPRAGTRNHVVWTEGEDNEGNYSFNKRRKWPKACAAHKDMEELANRSSEGKAAGAGDVNLSSLNGKNLEDNENSLVSRSTQTKEGKKKVKQQSGSKKKQNQTSISSAPSEASDMPNSSGKLSLGKESKKTEINSSSSTLTEVVDSNISTKSVQKKTTRSSNKKGKSNTKARSPLKSNEEDTVKSDGKVSPEQNSQLVNKTKSQGQKSWRQFYPPTSKSVVVVESVTKAKVIQGYLGEMFEVLPSYGHVRDLAARSGSVRPDDDFSMVWEVPSAAWSHLKSIKVALSGAENLILASDPDREGEAIAWHIIEMLKQQDALREDVTVARVVFNEITESSIKSALQVPREIDADLVHAYLARRALDYLIGFNVSPLLWRKLPGCQSAGRVQSAALALICDREKEIDEFKAQEYWTIDVLFLKKDQNSANNVFSLVAFDPF